MYVAKLSIFYHCGFPVLSFTVRTLHETCPLSDVPAAMYERVQGDSISIFKSRFRFITRLTIIDHDHWSFSSVILSTNRIQKSGLRINLIP